MRTAALALALLGLGCRAPVDRARADGYRFLLADPDQVDAHCKKKMLAAGGHYDDGTLVKVGDGRRVRCCARRRWAGTTSIIVARGDEDCIPHELCHAEGRPAAECHRVGWNQK